MLGSSHMKKELQQSLFKKYPVIFRKKDSPGFSGIQCPDSWHFLLDALCLEIQSHVNEQISSRVSVRSLVPVRDYCGVEVDQVKEKFGQLRFYVTGDDDYVRGLVRMAESISKNLKDNK